MLQIPRSKEKMSDTKPIYLFPSPLQHTHTYPSIFQQNPICPQPRPHPPTYKLCKTCQRFWGKETEKHRGERKREMREMCKMRVKR